MARTKVPAHLSQQHGQQVELLLPKPASCQENSEDCVPSRVHLCVTAGKHSTGETLSIGSKFAFWSTEPAKV